MNWLRLLLRFAAELAVSVGRVSMIILSGRTVHPALVDVPLRVKGDGPITLLATLVTLTPGTLSVDVSDDQTRLLVHMLDAPDPEAAAQAIRDGLEEGVLRAWR